MNHILIVEDDKSISRLIELTLKHSGFKSTVVSQITKAKETLQVCDFDFAILDIGLKDGLGYELVKTLKEKTVPFVFLTARGLLTEKLYGIELGADDYIVKPFEPLELVARIKMILRRTQATSSCVRLFEDLSIHVDSRLVKKGEQSIDLTPIEFDLLEVLSRTPGKSFSRNLLLDLVWGYDACGSTRTVDTHVLTLRQKIGASFIRTVYKVGYAFNGDK